MRNSSLVKRPRVDNKRAYKCDAEDREIILMDDLVGEHSVGVEAVVRAMVELTEKQM